jgi:UPF0176 protein
MTKDIIVTAFYKYVEIGSPEKFQEEYQEYCNELGVKGKILVSDEGVNGSISGTKAQINTFKKQLLKNKLFADVVFKDNGSTEHPFKKMIVRVRPEVVTFAKRVSMKNRAKYVDPKTLKKWIENNEAVLVDARNEYESRIGKFTGAITSDIKTFKQFPEYVEKLSNIKDKKVVTYCTGGIRCEKASAFLKEQGFQEVYQLQDGILNYIEQFPDSHFEGRCFVFDSRLSVPSGTKNDKIATCDLCHVPCDNYINCKNTECDKMFICCDGCDDNLSGTCSKSCKNLLKHLI